MEDSIENDGRTDEIVGVESRVIRKLRSLSNSSAPESPLPTTVDGRKRLRAATIGGEVGRPRRSTDENHGSVLKPYVENPPEADLDEHDYDDNSGDGHDDYNDDTLQGRRKKHRRGKNKGGMKHAKRWKPYSKMTWPERQELEDRETARANMKREERFLHGHPVAPYNTTQFLMNEHSKNENISPFVKNSLEDMPLGPHPPPNREGSGSMDSSDFEEPPNDEEDSFLAKDFSETYENIHAERLQAMSKQELITDYLDLETKVERLENRLRKVETKTGPNNNVPGCDSSSAIKQTDPTPIPKDNDKDIIYKSACDRMKDEIDRLIAENVKLKNENRHLQLQSLRAKVS